MIGEERLQLITKVGGAWVGEREIILAPRFGKDSLL